MSDLPVSFGRARFGQSSYLETALAENVICISRGPSLRIRSTGPLCLSAGSFSGPSSIFCADSSRGSRKRLGARIILNTRLSKNAESRFLLIYSLYSASLLTANNCLSTIPIRVPDSTPLQKGSLGPCACSLKSYASQQLLLPP